MPDSASGGVDPILRCQLLVFDLDGTLIDSQLDLSNSVNATLTGLGRRRLSAETIATFIGNGATALVQRSLDATGGSSDALMARAMPFFLTYYRAHKLDSTYVYAGVFDALRAIRQAAPNLLMAVLTNKPVGPSRSICEGLGLSEFFFANFGGDSFATKKPDPEGLFTIIRDAGLRLNAPMDASRCVMIGDSPVDTATARAAGTLSLGCTYGLDPKGLAASAPDASVDSAADWPDALRSLFCDR